jgi:hypothetical protein
MNIEEEELLLVMCSSQMSYILFYFDKNLI